MEISSSGRKQAWNVAWNKYGLLARTVKRTSQKFFIVLRKPTWRNSYNSSTEKWTYSCSYEIVLPKFVLNEINCIDVFVMNGVREWLCSFISEKCCSTDWSQLLYPIQQKIIRPIPYLLMNSDIMIIICIHIIYKADVTDRRSESCRWVHYKFLQFFLFIISNRKKYDASPNYC